MAKTIWGEIMEYKNIKIPLSLYNRLEDMLTDNKFMSVGDFIIDTLRTEVAKYNVKQDGIGLTENDEELIKQRLKELDYII